MLYLNKLIN